MPHIAHRLPRKNIYMGHIINSAKRSFVIAAGVVYALAIVVIVATS